MRTTIEMYEFSRKYTPISAFGTYFESRDSKYWFDNMFEKIVSNLETNENVEFAFNATNCSIKGTMLCNLSIAITQSRIIICGYKTSTHEILCLDCSVNEIKEIFIRAEENERITDLYLGEKYMLTIGYSNVVEAKKIYDLASALKNLLNAEIKDVKDIKEIKEKNEGIKSVIDYIWFHHTWVFALIIILIMVVAVAIYSEVTYDPSIDDSIYGICDNCNKRMKCYVCGEKGPCCGKEFGGEGHYCAKDLADIVR